MPKKQKWGQQNADRETTDARGVLSWEAVPAAFALYCASLWTGRVLKQHQLSKNQIKALSRCAKGQLEEGLHFFGSNSRNLSWGAQRIPFTWDTLFESQTPGYDSSNAAQHNLSCWTWTNAFFISSTESGIELGLCVCVCAFSNS